MAGWDDIPNDKMKGWEDIPSESKEQKSYALSEVPGQALENFPKEMWSLVKAFFDPQTYKNLAKFIPTPHEPRIPTSEEVQTERERNIDIAKNMKEYLYGKYGTYENIKRTVAEKPVDFLSDLSTFVSGIGGVSKISKIGTVWKAIEPFNVVMAPLKVGKLAMGGKVKQIAQKLYTSATGFSSKMELENIHRTAQRGLDLGILSKEKDLENLKRNMDFIGSKINKTIEKGAMAKEGIDTWTIANSLDDLKEMFGSKLFHDPELPKIIDDLKQSLLDLHGEKIPIEVAQDIKRTTQKFLKGSYDRLTAIKTEAEKIANSQIRQELEKLHPELAKLNPTQQENVWLKQWITDAIKRQEKAKLAPGISFFNVIKNKTIDDPILKERLAIIINKIRKRPYYPSTTTYGRLGIEEARRIQMEE